MTKNLTEQLKLVKRFSEDIQMEFGLDKCAKCTFVDGKPTKTNNIKVDLETTIQQLENKASYISFEVEEGHQIYHKQMHKTITKEYLCRMRLIPKTYLTLRNKIKAINQIAIPVFQYSCGIINWLQVEINRYQNKETHH